MRKSGFIIPIVGAGICLVTAGAVIAGKQGHGHWFDKLDADGDGQITKAEADSARQAHFARIDADGNGKITAAEFEGQARKKHAERAAKIVEHLDKNGDGAVTENEFAAGKKGRLFEKADADGDGVVTAEEWQAMKKARHGHGKHRE